MSSNLCLALLLDAPMQSWGYTSRYRHRTTALHPTRSGILGLIAAALGIDKHAANEAERLAVLAPLHLTVLTLPRRTRRGDDAAMRRLEDYHTVTGIRRASGKVDLEATVPTYRHYLSDTRFGVLVEGPRALLEEVALALLNPVWGVWLGRKCCIPASPVLVGGPDFRPAAWAALLRRAGYVGEEPEALFDRVVEVEAAEQGAEALEDAPVAFGRALGERHAPRWIRRVPRSPDLHPQRTG